MKKNKLMEIQISELFLVRCGKSWDRTYMATITRGTDNLGNNVICGKVEVEDGKVWSMAESEDELARFLDELCFLKLEIGIHKSLYNNFYEDEISFSPN